MPRQASPIHVAVLDEAHVPEWCLQTYDAIPVGGFFKGFGTRCAVSPSRSLLTSAILKVLCIFRQEEGNGAKVEIPPASAVVAMHLSSRTLSLCCGACTMSIHCNGRRIHPGGICDCAKKWRRSRIRFVFPIAMANVPCNDRFPVGKTAAEK